MYVCVYVCARVCVCMCVCEGKESEPSKRSDKPICVHARSMAIQISHMEDKKQDDVYFFVCYIEARY